MRTPQAHHPTTAFRRPPHVLHGGGGERLPQARGAIVRRSRARRLGVFRPHRGSRRNDVRPLEHRQALRRRRAGRLAGPDRRARDAVTTPPRELAELTQAELEAGLRLRLVETESVADPDNCAYARVVAPGLLEVLSVDIHDSVVTPSREELALGGTLGELIERGRENLRGLLTTESYRCEIVDEGSNGATRSSRATRSSPQAWRSCCSEAVLHFTGRARRRAGTLVAVPDRHQLLYRVVDAPERSVRAAAACSRPRASAPTRRSGP